ncbi:MAG: zf-TFIIB domain-containing protein [Candidatus Sericytochromatia bacterium]
MQCPLCQVALLMSNREGIEIDYCPQCRGVWLDRGELDKIIERSLPGGGARQADYRPQGYDRRPQQASYDDYQRQGHKKKRESFLEDLFDFG